MWIAARSNNGAVQAIWCGGDMWVGDVAGAPGLYGMPQDALDFQARGGEIRPVSDETWSRLISNAQSSIPRAQAEAHILAAIKAVPAGSGGTGLTMDQAVAAVRTGLGGAPVTLSGKLG